MVKYFDGKLSSGFVALYSGRLIQFAAEGLISIFVPIFLLQKYDYDVQQVILYFLIGYGLYYISLPSAMQIINRIGLRRSLRLSIIWQIMVMTCYYFVDLNSTLLLSLSLIFVTLYRLCFWVPYHTDFAKFSDHRNRAKEVSLIDATQSFISIIAPALSGFLIASLGFHFVFAVGIAVYFTSLIPYIALPRTRERFSWSTFETFKQFFHHKNRSLILSNIANGAENSVSAVIWPMFIWMLLEGNYFTVGAVSSLIVLVAIVIQLITGKYADVMDKRRMMRWGSIFYAFGWIFKIFVLNAFHIFVVGTYHSFSAIFKNTPFDALNYELLSDSGHLVDEHTVLKEMSLQLGRMLMMILAFFVAQWVSINWIFMIAAFASLCVNFL